MIKVLLIEDDDFVGKIYQSALTERGFEVVVAPDGEAGIKAAQTDRPDVIISDVIMPKKNGFEVLEQLKKDPQTKAIPVIMFSNLAQSQDKQQAQALGASDYLVKNDTTYDSLAEAIKKVLPS